MKQTFQPLPIFVEESVTLGIQLPPVENSLVIQKFHVTFHRHLHHSFFFSSGDPMEEKFVRNFDIFHQRNIYNKLLEGPSGEILSKSVTFSYEEPVQYVTITPIVEPKEEFSISFKVVCRIMSPVSKVVYSKCSKRERKIHSWKY